MLFAGQHDPLAIVQYEFAAAFKLAFRPVGVLDGSA